jgi:hypothetical protein
MQVDNSADQWQCPLHTRWWWQRVHLLHDKIVAVATDPCRTFVRDGHNCHGCAELFTILVGVYLAIQRRTLIRRFPSSLTHDDRLAADCLHLVAARLDFVDRRSAAAVCKTWHDAIHDPLLADTAADATALLKSHFAKLNDGYHWTRMPLYEGLVVAWALTQHWLTNRE